jgi:cation diffusion facilitator CzcD-associated flavoprotein CzcO
MSSTPPSASPTTAVPDAERRHSQILLIGTGFCGIGMARRLIRSGFTDLVVLERGDSVGGTWRDNTYPGVACDAPSHLYSYSFALNPNWSRVYAPGREIWQYLVDVALREGVERHVRFNTDVLGATWDEDGSFWVVETDRGTYTAHFLITASGHLSDPKLPDIPGLDRYEGEMFHSAKWDASLDLAGKRIGVIGTGASAIQIIPEIAPEAASLTVFQRSAPYIVPRLDRAYTEAEKRMFGRLPETMRRIRDEMYWNGEARYPERRLIEAFTSQVRQSALGHLASQVSDPELRAKLTPDYEVGCKRILRANNYYPTFALPHVHLEVNRIVESTPRGLRTADQMEHELDAIILATGFEASDLPLAHVITGRGGLRLSEHWLGGEQGVAGVGVHGFPNLFVMNGPHAGLGAGSIIFMLETQISYVGGAFDYIRANDVRTIEATQEAEDAFGADMDERAKGSVWLDGGCRSWYVDQRNGRLTTIWPDFTRRYNMENGTLDPSGYAIERRRELASAVL